MDRTARFWDRLALRYSKKPVPNEQVYLKKLELTRDQLSPESVVLEFGCGTGSTAIAHAPFVKRVRAVDFSEKMLTIARGKAEASNVKNVDFEQASIDDLDVSGERYDAILGLSVLHLLENKEAVVQKVYEMLKPGGVFVSSTVCMAENYSWFKFLIRPGRLLGLLPILKIFDRQSLEESISAAGFAIETLWKPESSDAVFIIARK